MFSPTDGNDTAFLVGPGTATVDFKGGVDTLDMGTEKRFDYTIIKASDGSVRVNSISSASGGGLNLTLKNLELITFDSGRDTIDLRTFFGPPPAPTPLQLNGTSGNDMLRPSTGLVNVDGLAGLDTVVLAQARSGYTVKASSTGYAVTGKDGSATYSLTQVERLQFADATRLALDVAGNAGITAKVLGAVFGAASIKAQPNYVGIGLQLLDSGTSYEALMQLALDARLGANATPTQVVTLLYTNVVGVAPPPADLALYVGLLNNKSFTPATLGILAADTELNTTKIDLMGLAQTGIDYTLA